MNILEKIKLEYFQLICNEISQQSNTLESYNQLTVHTEWGVAMNHSH